jgi:hypothetical protein
MSHREPKPDRGSIVKDVHYKLIQTDKVRETLDHVGDFCKAVRKSIARRHVGLAEPREIRCHDTELLREERNEVAKHVAGGRKSVQEEDGRRVPLSGFAVEDIEAVNIQLVETDPAQGNVSFIAVNIETAFS